MKTIYVIIALCLIVPAAHAGEPGVEFYSVVDNMSFDKMKAFAKRIEILCQERIDDYYLRLQDDELTNRESHDYFMSDREWWWVEAQFKVCGDILGFMGKEVKPTF